MKAPAPRRKGASRTADITPELLQALSLGEIETATLTESLAVDQALLLQAVFPDAWPQLEDTAQALGRLGILKRMECIGGLLWQALGQMFEHDRSAARGEMSTRGLYVFQHDSELGNAPAHALFERLQVHPQEAGAVARSFDAYAVTFDGQSLAVGQSLQPAAGVTLTRLF